MLHIFVPSLAPPLVLTVVCDDTSMLRHAGVDACRVVLPTVCRAFPFFFLLPDVDRMPRCGALVALPLSARLFSSFVAGDGHGNVMVMCVKHLQECIVLIVQPKTKENTETRQVRLPEIRWFQHKLC